MDATIRFLEQFRNSVDMMDIVDDPESMEEFNKHLKRKNIENIDGRYTLTEKGENRLMELRRLRYGGSFSQKINIKGDGVNLVGNASNSKINQTNSVTKISIPNRGIGSGWNPIIEWIFKIVGEKMASIIFAALSLLFAGLYSYLGIKRGFLPETGTGTGILLIKDYVPQYITLGLAIIMIISFFAIKSYKKRKKCPKCKKYLNYFPIKDGEVLEKSPHNHLKVKRFFKCPCGYKYSRTRWESPPENKN